MRAEDVQLYYQVGLVGKKDLPLAPDPRSGFEMAMLRMLAFSPDAVPVADNNVLKVESRESGAEGDKVASSQPSVESEPEPEPCEAFLRRGRML